MCDMCDKCNTYFGVTQGDIFLVQIKCDNFLELHNSQFWNLVFQKLKLTILMKVKSPDLILYPSDNYEQENP